MGVTSFHRAVCSLMLFQTLVIGAPASRPDYLQPFPSSPRNLTANEVMRELGGRLSSETTIFGPSNTAYRNATERWNTLEIPNIEVVVQVGQESDIAKIVCETVQPLRLRHLA